METLSQEKSISKELEKKAKYVVKPTNTTPGIKLMPAREYLVIKGRSNPANALEFYADLYKAIDKYIELGKKSFTVYLQLEYFNTSSAKCVFNVLRKLDKVRGDMDIKVNWYYEDEDDDMMEVGEDFSDSFGLEFIYVPFVSEKKQQEAA